MDLNEDEFRSKVNEINNPKKGTKLDVQWWIDNDLLPSENDVVPHRSRLSWSKERPYKECNVCKKEKHITNYSVRYRRSKRRNQLNIVSYCQECSWKESKPLQIRKYQGDTNDRAYKLKLLFIEYLGGCCSDCGFQGQPCQFDLDHINPMEKEYSLGGTKACHLDVDDLITEVKKCQLLCANCHRKHTVSENIQNHFPIYPALTVLGKMAAPVKDREHMRKSPEALNTSSG